MRNLALSVMVVVALATYCSASDTDSLSCLKVLPLAEGERAYPVEKGEAIVNDELITRITIGNREVVANYRNSGSDTKRPKYTITLYSEHGLLLGEDKVSNTMFGGSTYLDPGDVGTEKLYIEWYPLARIFAKSKRKLPENWKVVKWVVICETNTRPTKPAQ